MKVSNVQMRDAFINELYEHAKADRDIIFITNDQGAISLDRFRADLPKQFINAGISEQNIISIAAGLSLKGKKVYVYSIASFITLRCYEQIKLDLCVMNIPVTILGIGASFSYGIDGPTHHATEYISIMRALSNMQIYCPSDSNMAAKLVDISLNSKTPMYISMDREILPILYDENEDISPGISVLREGGDICIISTGFMVHRAMEVAQELDKHFIQAKVIDVYRLKPLNYHSIHENIQNSKKIITLEEHTINGGLGSIIAELMVDLDLRIPMKRLAIEDNFLYCYGIRENLHKERGLVKSSVVQLIIEWLKK